MAGLKLTKMPDKTPVKLTISMPPDIHGQLGEYLAQYRAAYDDESATIADLVPAMLESFLKADKGFQRERSKPSPSHETVSAQ